MSEAKSGAGRSLLLHELKLAGSPDDYGYFEMAAGAPEAWDYAGNPYKVVLGPKQPQENRVVLEVGKAEDLGYKMDQEYAIVDRKLMEETGGEKGFKGLRDGEEVVLGRETPGRFQFGETVSRSHVKIACQGDRITFTDLGSTNGTAFGLKRNPTPAPIRRS